MAGRPRFLRGAFDDVLPGIVNTTTAGEMQKQAHPVGLGRVGRYAVERTAAVRK